jgi:hypothetical protein
MEMEKVLAKKLLPLGMALEPRMNIENFRILIALTLAVLTAPVLADDCTTVKSAMLNSGHTPHNLFTTKSDGQGKKTVTRQVQTVDNKYVQTPDGKWYAMNIAIKDLDDDVSGVLTCRRSGSESVNGESTAVYDVHMNLEGRISDNRYWVSSKNLILKSEGVIEGVHYTTEYDFGHVTPPAKAIPMGGK